MGRRAGLLIYAVVLILVGSLTAAFTYSAKGISIAGCRPAPDPDQFISACGSPTFGDYEHDAFWFGLEPAAVANMKAADVIFTGSSRTMFGFSTTEVRSYFAARGLHQFNLGFSGEDGAPFFGALALKHHLHPRVLVIGIDPYFTERLSPPAAAAMSSRWEFVRAWVKRTEIRLQVPLCRWHILNCRAQAITAFRSSTDGYFTWRDVLLKDREHPRPHDTRLRDFQVNIPLAAQAAKAFLARIDMPAACVVMVPMPTTRIWPKPDPIKRVAEAVGAMYIDADTGDDLAFVDEMHLSYWSAKRFSAEFLRAFDRLPQTCLGVPAPLVATASAPKNP
jgi:hypothetical protein